MYPLKLATALAGLTFPLALFLTWTGWTQGLGLPIWTGLSGLAFLWLVAS